MTEWTWKGRAVRHVTGPEVKEMLERSNAGESVWHIAAAMDRAQATVAHYVPNRFRGRRRKPGKRYASSGKLCKPASFRRGSYKPRRAPQKIAGS